jgi:hypothetical protein
LLHLSKTKFRLHNQFPVVVAGSHRLPEFLGWGIWINLKVRAALPLHSHWMHGTDQMRIMGIK